VTPLTSTVDSVATPLTDGVLTSATPLTSTVDSIVNPLSDTVEEVVAPFVVTVPALESEGPTSMTAAGEVAGADSGGDASTDGAVAPTSHALVDGATVTATPVTAAHGSDILADPAGSIFAGPLAMPAGADPSAPFGAASPALVPGPAGAEIVDQVDGATVPDTVVTAFPDPSGTAGPGMLDPLSSTSDSPLAVLAEVAPDARVLVSAAVLALAGAAVLGPRAGGSGADLPMAFRNVRLLPCMIKASLERHVSMLAEAVAADGGSLFKGGSHVAQLGDSAADAGRTGASSGRGGVRGSFDYAFESFRDGFERAIVDTRDDVDEGLRDTRLMMQVGMLLGFVYLGFLTVWFWATRGRSSLRA
jgi:hypothetical protein